MLILFILSLFKKIGKHFKFSLLFMLEYLSFATSTFNLPILVKELIICLFRLLLSTLSKSTIVIFSTPHLTKLSRV